MNRPGPAVADAGSPRSSPGGLVLVVTTSYPRTSGDFAGSFVKRRVDDLRALGAPVEVIAAGEPAGPDELMSEGAGASAAAVWVERVGFAAAGQATLFYGDGAPERLEQALASWLQAARLWGGLVPAVRARSGRVSSVESHWLIPSALAVAAAKLAVPHRAVAHSGDVALLERLPLGGALARWLVPRISHLAFVSDELRGRFGRLVGREHAARVAEAQVIPAASGAEGSTPRLAAEDRGQRQRQRGIEGGLVLAVGRLVPIKGHDLLVRAVGRLAPQRRPTVVILGEGGERGRLQELARARGVRLVLPGQVPGDEVGRWLSMADLFVHPSRPLGTGRTEGAPVALREAIAAGVPVLAARTGGIPEVAGIDGDQLFPAEDVAALSHRLDRALGFRSDLETAPLRTPDS